MTSRRKSTRYDCSLPAILKYQSSSVSCTVVNLSSGGISIATSSLVRIEIGEQVTVVQTDLGNLVGAVRWVGMGTFGMKLDRNMTGLKVFSAINTFINDAA